MSPPDDSRKAALERLRYAAECIQTAAESALRGGPQSTRLTATTLEEASDLAFTIVASMGGNESLLIRAASDGIDRLGSQSNLVKGQLVDLVGRGLGLCDGDRERLAFFLADTLPQFYKGWGDPWQFEFVQRRVPGRETEWTDAERKEAQRKGEEKRTALARRLFQSLQAADVQAGAPGLTLAVLDTNEGLRKQLGYPTRDQLTNAISSLRKRRNSNHLPPAKPAV